MFTLLTKQNNSMEVLDLEDQVEHRMATDKKAKCYFYYVLLCTYTLLLHYIITQYYNKNIDNLWFWVNFRVFKIINCHCFYNNTQNMGGGVPLPSNKREETTFVTTKLNFCVGFLRCPNLTTGWISHERRICRSLGAYC